MSGDTSKAEDDGGDPEESFLFLLTSTTNNGNGSTGDVVWGLVKAVGF